MDHANNAVYLDWLEEAVLAASPDGAGRRSRRCRDATGSSTRRPPTPAMELDGRRLARRRTGPGATGSTATGGPERVPGARLEPPTEEPHDPDRPPRWPGLRRHRRRPGRAATSRSRTAGSSTSAPGSTATRRSTSPAGRSCRGCSTATSTSARSTVDPWRASPAAVLATSSTRRRGTCWRRSRIGDHVGPRRRRRRPRDQGRRVEDGLIAGPRMQISISCSARPAATATTGIRRAAPRSRSSCRHPGRPYGIVDGPDEIRRKVRELAPERRRRDQGRDRPAACCRRATIPRHAHFRPAELEALVEEATAAGMFVMAHAQGADGIKNAVRAGDPLDRARHLPRRRGDRADAGHAGPGSSRRSSRRRASSTPPTPASRSRRPSSTRRATVIDVHRAGFRQAVEAGVRIAMGTDSGVTPHGRNLRELAADGRGRDDAGGGARGDDAERRPAARRRRRPRHDRAGQARRPRRRRRATRTTSPTLGERVEQVWKAGARVV